MAEIIKSVTGAKDILPEEFVKWNFVTSAVRKIFSSYNYSEISTPIFEETNLFARSIGEETDIVSKEMYTFLDKGNTSLTLRPEMTASVVRAFIEHSLEAKQPVQKLFYVASMFRQERPQAGRLRQFHQFGAEALGSRSPLLDAEMILCAYKIFSLLGLKDLKVVVNSLGKKEERENFKSALNEFLQPKLKNLTEESRKRFETNILRILDSKAEVDQHELIGAPKLYDFLTEESKVFFEDVISVLKSLSIPHEINYGLVRGLDYYCDTTFEILSGKVGAQSALCGGGRYDGLIEQLGGKPSHGVGFAAGIERLLLALENENALPQFINELDYYIILLDKTLTQKAFEIAIQLREKGKIVELDYLNRSVKAQMREANKFNAKKAIFIGGEEFKQNKISVKNMKSNEQSEIFLDEFLSQTD